jgi:predicted MFS family arabinose efflux permease
VSGALGPHYGWRLPFLIISVPALVCGFLVATTATEPARGDQEEEMLLARVRHEQGAAAAGSDGTRNACASSHLDSSGNTDSDKSSSPMRDTHSTSAPVYSEHIDWAKVSTLLHTPSVLLCIFQGLPACIPWGVFWVFLNDYLSEDRGLKVHQATGVLSVFGVGTVVGVLSGGALGKWLYMKDKRYQCLLMGASTTLSLLPILLLFNVPAKESYSDGFLFFVAFCAGWLMSITGVNIKVVLQNVTSPETRGTAFALHSIFDDLGKGGGPALVAAWIVVMGRKAALNLAASMVLPAALSLFLLALFVESDETRVQFAVREAMDRSSHGGGTKRGALDSVNPADASDHFSNL